MSQEQEIPSPTEEEVQPEEEQPGEDQPEEALPEEDQPEEDQPEEALQEEDQPEEALPEEDQPEEVLQEEDQSEEDQPEEALQEEDQPEEALSEEDQPEEDQPEEVLSEEDQPEEDQPESLPEGDQPEEGQPEEGQPEESLTEEDQPEEALPEEEPPEVEEPEEEQPEDLTEAIHADTEEKISIHITTSPVFQSLVQFLEEERISRDTMDEVTEGFTDFQDTLHISQELPEEVLLSDEQQQQQPELERNCGGPEHTKRVELLILRNSLLQAEECLNLLQEELESLQEQKNVLLMNFETRRKPAELISNLKESIEELQMEVTDRKVEIKNLGGAVKNQQNLIVKEQKETEEQVEVIKNLEGELVQLLSVPGQLGKETERTSQKKSIVESKIAALEKQLKQLDMLKCERQPEVQKVTKELSEADLTLEENREQLIVEENESTMQQKQHDLAREKDVALMGQRALLDLNMAHVAAEKKSLQEMSAKGQKEKDRQLRSQKRLEMQVHVGTESLQEAKNVFNKVKAERDAMPPLDEQTKRKTELEKKVQHLKRSLMQQQYRTDTETQKLELCLTQEQEMLKERQVRKQVLNDLCRLARIKANEREEKSQELKKAQFKYNHTTQELKRKAQEITEHKKNKIHAQIRLKALVQMHQSVNEEMRKCWKLSYKAELKRREWKERVEMLENEIEILGTSINNNEMTLMQMNQKQDQILKHRDSLMKNRDRVALELQVLLMQREKQMFIGHLTKAISQQQQRMLQLNKHYEETAKSRNDCGVVVLQREEELSIFNQKINTEDGLIRDGNVETKAMEDQIHFLQLLVVREKKQIEMSQKKLNCKKNLEEKSANLKLQIVKYRDQRLELEKSLEDEQNKQRRALTRTVPSLVGIQEKWQQKEEWLLESETQLIEKELIYEQVTQLMLQLEAKEKSTKYDSVELAKKMNELQRCIIVKNRSIMATVSELSMWQAKTITLQREVQEKELQLKISQERLERGLSPSEVVKIEMQRKKRAERISLLQQQEAQLAEKRASMGRPNAYIPDSDDLPLPRPYGAHAPFKPGEPGSSMRHFRKPEPKPIEI